MSSKELKSGSNLEKKLTSNKFVVTAELGPPKSADLEHIKKVDLKEKGLFNFYKGKFLEIIVQQIMSRFDGEELKGELFGKKGKKIRVNKFIIIDERYTKGIKTSNYQIDIYAKAPKEKSIWLCECKNKKSKMGIKEIKKLEEAKRAYLMQMKQENLKTNENVKDQKNRIPRFISIPQRTL